LIDVHITDAAKGRFVVCVVLLCVDREAKLAGSLLPRLQLIRHAVERAKGRFGLAIVRLVVRLPLHVETILHILSKDTGEKPAKKTKRKTP
jgi:hypothetical protein